MKKRIFSTAGVATFAVAMAFNINAGISSNAATDIALANVEALVQGVSMQFCSGYDGNTSGWGKKNPNYKKESVFVLEPIGSKQISLPEGTSSLRNPLQYMQTPDGEFIFYFDQIRAVIYCIDYKMGRTIEGKTIQITAQRADERNIFHGFFVLSSDSLLVLDYHRTSTIFLLNGKGDIVNTYRLGENRGSLIGLEQEPYRNGDELLLAGYSPDETATKIGSLPVCDIYDTAKKTYLKNEKIDYPDYYYKYHWGGGFLREPHTTACYPKNTYIYSFPVSHDIHVYDVKKKQVKTFCAGSSFIEQISPYKTGKDYNPDEKTDYLKYALEQASYYKVLYDPYRQIYYRLVGLPSAKLDMKDMKTYKKELSVIILDKDFSFLGETFLGIDYEPFCAFVNKDGLNILSKYIVGKKIEFSTFLPKRKQQ
ncbi:hypothetical protein FACS189430_03530 [Bacteroidia bacterium]|nr:hypothetical protein FACS189430_03530 [Bacteroidia bacterium]